MANWGGARPAVKSVADEKVDAKVFSSYLPNEDLCCGIGTKVYQVSD